MADLLPEMGEVAVKLTVFSCKTHCFFLLFFFINFIGIGPEVIKLLSCSTQQSMKKSYC